MKIGPVPDLQELTTTTTITAMKIVTNTAFGPYSVHCTVQCTVHSAQYSVLQEMAETVWDAFASGKGSRLDIEALQYKGTPYIKIPWTF